MEQVNGANNNSGSPDEARPAGAGQTAARDFVVGVILNSGGRAVDYYWNNIELKVGDLCIVKEKNLPECGTVTLSRRPYSVVCQRKEPSGKIVRRANENDMKQARSNARREKTALNYCRERIYERDLRMSLSKVQYMFDGRKAIFYFTAESRIDFRDLVKDLSNFTRVKVEMRQIGVRDEAKMLGGCGPCGHELCCAKFLSDFVPVSIRMAKDQMLSLSPEKISGVCGRLMCCLAYEHGTYKEMRKKFPKMGKMMETPDGRLGKVCQLNILYGKISVVYEDGMKKEFDTSELDLENARFKEKAAPSPEPEETPSREDIPAQMKRKPFAPVHDTPTAPARKRKRRRSRNLTGGESMEGRTQAEKPPGAALTAGREQADGEKKDAPQSFSDRNTAGKRPRRSRRGRRGSRRKKDKD